MKYFTVLLVFLLSLRSGAETPKVQSIQVNGYSVYLVDLKQGNQLGYVFTVPYGSADDPQKHFGRAHFFEHMLARGSSLYPGHETLIQAMTGFGYQRNASTGLGYTMYFASGHESRGLEAMRMHMAGLHDIELEASSFRREKATVINEVVDSRPNNPGRSIFTIPFLEWVAKDHPLFGNHLGTREILESMSERDLRQLHQQIYQPGNVDIVVLANFTSGTLSTTQVVDELTHILPKNKKTITRYKAAVQPSIFLGQKNKLIEIRSESEQTAVLIFDLPQTTNPHQVESFLELLLNGHREGLTDLLRRRLGWVERISSEVLRIGGRQMALIDFDMTDEGFARRDEIVAHIVSAIQAHKVEPFGPEVIRESQMMIESTGNAIDSNLSKLLRFYPKWLAQPGYEAEVQLNWSALAAKINPDYLMDGAKSLNPQRLGVVYFGPVNLDNPKIDPIHQVKYQVGRLSLPKTNTSTYHPLKIKVAQVPLAEPHRGQSMRRQNSWRVVDSSFSEIFRYSPEWDSRAVILKFQYGLLQPSEQNALGALISQFVETYAPEMEFLASRGTFVGIHPSDGGLTVAVRGQSGQEFAAATWFIQRLKEYRINPELIHRYKSRFSKRVLQAEEGFPANVAGSIAADLLEHDSSWLLKRSAVIADLGPAAIEHLRNTRLQSSNKVLVIAGEFNDFEHSQAINAMRAFSPGRLNQATLDQYPKVRIESESLAFQEPWLNKESSGFGLARMMALPDAQFVRTNAALAVARSLLHQQVFLKNRPLGYVQSVSTLGARPDAHHLVYSGQVSNEQDLQKIYAVWDEQTDRWILNQWSDEDVAKARDGLISSLEKRPASSLAAAESALGNLVVSGHPFQSRRLLDELKKLSVGDIKEIARLYFASARPRLEIIKGGGATNCSAILSGRSALQRQFVQKSNE